MGNEIKVFKLVTGEELLAERFNVFADHVEVKNPAQIILQRGETGMGVAMAPWLPYADGNIDIRKTAILAICNPDQKLTNEYNRIFGSGIEIAPAHALAGLKPIP